MITNDNYIDRFTEAAQALAVAPFIIVLVVIAVVCLILGRGR